MEMDKQLRSARLTRRDFLRTAGMVGAGVVASAYVVPAALAAEAPAARVLAPAILQGANPDLKEGAIGGPTGFEGAEQFQYSADTPAGRAIEGIKALPADKKPAKLVLQLADGVLGQYDVPYPEGAPSVRNLFTQETGVELELVGISPDDQRTKIIQDATTRAAQFDVYSFWTPDKGVLTEAGAFLILNDLVEQYKPEWEKSYIGGEKTVQQVNTYAGNIVCVNTDGDEQIWQYRKDLFEDPKEMADFKARYGWDLQWPETFDQLAQIAEHFHRPDQGLFGMTDLRNRGWGFVNWYQRFVCAANPYQLMFDSDTGSPTVLNEAGIRATQEFADTLKWHSPDGMNWGWPEQYANFAAGGAAMSSMYPNAPKFLDNPDNPDSVVVGKMRSGVQPGRVIDGVLVRRVVWWPNIGMAVSSQTAYPEASYLFLQWLSSAHIYSWLVGNPAGYYDPFLVSDLETPSVVSSYKDWHMPIIKASIERQFPPNVLNGNVEYESALDDNLQAVMIGTKTAEQAMEDCTAAWEAITDRLGRDKQIAAMKAMAETYSTVVDTPTIGM
jgi:multiple sugar transport system substrate-binding protein